MVLLGVESFPYFNTWYGNLGQVIFSAISPIFDSISPIFTNQSSTLTPPPIFDYSQATSSSQLLGPMDPPLTWQEIVIAFYGQFYYNFQATKTRILGFEEPFEGFSIKHHPPLSALLQDLQTQLFFPYPLPTKIYHI